METNTKNRDAMLDKISQINAVEGFDPSAFVEEYQNDEHPEIPAAARLICEHALKTA